MVKLQDMGIGGCSDLGGATFFFKQQKCDFLLLVDTNDNTAMKFTISVNIHSASYLVLPTFDILTCDDVLLPRAGSTGAIEF